MSKKWDERFMDRARHIAKWSKDPSTKCGCVIVKDKHVVSEGYNGFPAGTSDDEELYFNREEKYRRILHAELNAVLFAKCDLDGCTAYVWPMPPCSQCAAVLIQSGINRVVTVTPTQYQAERWYKSFETMSALFRDAGVQVDYD